MTRNRTRDLFHCHAFKNILIFGIKNVVLRPLNILDNPKSGWNEPSSGQINLSILRVHPFFRFIQKNSWAWTRERSISQLTSPKKLNTRSKTLLWWLTRLKVNILFYYFNNKFTFPRRPRKNGAQNATRRSNDRGEIIRRCADNAKRREK